MIVGKESEAGGFLFKPHGIQPPGSTNGVPSIGPSLIDWEYQIVGTWVVILYGSLMWCCGYVELLKVLPDVSV
jgi:hypothetical protein